jgi:hypothetical protein
VPRTTVRSSARQRCRYDSDMGSKKEGVSGHAIQVCRIPIYSMCIRRGMRSRIVVVPCVARRSCSSVIVGAVTIGSIQCNSQDHSSWDSKQLAVVCAVGSAPTPRAAPGKFESKKFCSDKPTVSLGVTSAVVSSCGHDRGQIEQRVAHKLAVPLATQRGRAKRIQHRHPPRAQPIAPMRERHCRGPWITPRSCIEQAPRRDQG